ncbi:e3 ubiquitin-protein ligase [Nesidiocoris tenuis]|uniref:E3 ubiquitin-protein ligase n=1 Tax=Nesidiocoris tenuis TaxID=355587 RepID=A0ABN7ASC1_9HEMI|nr:e3 ubiquitin-protein ligase [Nesidiocoris tenuis]
MSDDAATSGGDDGESTILLSEFIRQEDQLEEDANAVLGPSDHENCSYDKGYVPRQALYSCKTCAKDSVPAGVCLACCLHCHEGHDLVELYTKRFFRCDCGNKKFGGVKCTLAEFKDAENEKNAYNQNFQGLYCTCQRPYPDPENDNEDDIMLQCTVCEDWFHTEHLSSEFPGTDAFVEVICGACTKKLDFLEYYSGIMVTKVSKEADESKTVDVTSDAAADAPKTQPEESVQTEPKLDTAVSNSKPVSDVSSSSSVIKQLPTVEKSPEECILKSRVRVPLKEGATFWPEDFRSKLCPCPECKEMYSRLNVSWIIDENDTITAYQSKATKLEQPDEQSIIMNVISGMDRVAQVEAISSYNDLKSGLKNFLDKFATSKKVIRREDISEFFSEMRAKKRQKLDNVPPYMCR